MIFVSLICDSQIVKQFWRCGSCGQIFWMGPKSQRALDQLQKEFPRSDDEMEDSVAGGMEDEPIEMDQFEKDEIQDFVGSSVGHKAVEVDQSAEDDEIEDSVSISMRGETFELDHCGTSKAVTR